ncbi:zinc-binding protein A33-like isoform X2 [Sceloporus undulatus]|uniref:zinc-binding protein A33-like isoform X2 n=1 Tax=Sceloporus undulatus TaxID=8520 RepID=UPI001C4D612B|nr:zinc-binding protein A33-like isoform X2 [Sceloporus undulatus]
MGSISWFLKMAHSCQEQSLREELTCAICFDLFRDPVMLDCMHHFCQECIQSYWDSCSDVATCPQCRREFPTRSFRPQYLVSGVVEKVRRCTSEEHRRKVQHLEEALQSFHMEHEKLMKMKLGAEEKICSLLKTSGELNSKIRAAFEHLHRILDKEERTVLMELAREEGQWLMRLEGDSARLAERMSDLKKNMEHIQQQIDNLEIPLLLEVESVTVRYVSRKTRSCFSLISPVLLQWNVCVFLSWEEEPATDVEALTTFSIEQHKDLYDGPLQYTFWRKMLKSVSPAPAPLVFDPETAHPNLILSKDLTAVTERETPQHVSRSPKRFLQSVNILGKASFESGRHYWEVWVGNKTKWDLGVAAHSVDRTARVRLCPENGYWAIRLREDTEYWAAATPWVRLRPRHSLKKVGILLDCSTNKVAFYNAEDMSFLFAFHQAQAHKFYPFFSTCFSDGKKNQAPMRICHLNL